MYAIVRTGGKQYQVASGDQLRVEKLDGSVGDTVELTIGHIGCCDPAGIGRPIIGIDVVQLAIIAGVNRSNVTLIPQFDMPVIVGTEPDRSHIARARVVPPLQSIGAVAGPGRKDRELIDEIGTVGEMRTDLTAYGLWNGTVD